MATILFDPDPSTGHYNASYGLAECLKNNGHRIVYVGIEEFREVIYKKGWEFYTLEPHPIPFIYLESKQYGSFVTWVNNITESLTRKREKQFMKIQNTFDNTIKKINPDLILLDAFQIGKAVYYHKFNLKLITFQSMVATNEDSFAPPFRYSFVPSESILSDLYVKFLWKKRILWKNLRIHFYRLWHFKQGYIEQLRKTAQQTGFPFDKEFDINHYVGYGFSFRSIPELILSPPEFDFRRKFKPNQYLVGPIMHYQRDSNHSDSRCLKVLDTINSVKANSNNKIAFIYCSLGTNTFKELELVNKFFQKIRHLCFTNKDICVMLSVGKHYDTNLLGNIPTNLFVFTTVPQMEILKHCDIMITHGGMNTLTECIINEIPMLVFPLVKIWDQPGNAARVVYHGLGLKGTIKGDSVTRIQSKINDILNNYQLFKDKLSLMHGRFNLDYKKEYAVSIIEKQLKPKTYE